MKRVQKILFRPFPIILGLLVLFLLAGASLLPKTASASNARVQTPTIGAYDCTNTNLTGPMAGQTEQVTLTFNADGTMSSDDVTTGLSGQGSWWAVTDAQGNEQDSYSFRLLLPPDAIPGVTDIQAVHLITDVQDNGNSFTSQGDGLFYNGGDLVSTDTAQTTVQCTLQPGA